MEGHFRRYSGMTFIFQNPTTTTSVLLYEGGAISLIFNILTF
jgi:hypothetical protein